MKKLLLAGLLAAVISPVGQAAGFNFHRHDGEKVKRDLPSLIALLKMDGQSVANFKGKLVSSPRSWDNRHKNRFLLRSEPRPSSLDVCDPEQGECPGVPEPDGLGAVLASGILGLGFVGYTLTQRRRICSTA